MRIGIDLGGSHISVGLINENLELLDKDERSFTEEEKRELNNIIIKKIVEIINNILQRNNIEVESLELIGIASPGTITNGVISRAANLGLDKFNMKKELKEYYDTQIIVRNDAKCAALFEKSLGSIKNYKDCIFITLGTGIGGAVFINNKLLFSNKYPGFEVGHIVIEKSGNKCTCGKTGCFESYGSMKVLKNRIKEEYNIKEDTNSRKLLEILANKSDKSEKIIEEYLDDLVAGLSSLVDLFEPEIISIGGSFAYYEDLFLSRLKEKINKPNITYNQRDDIEVIIAHYKNDSGIIGSIIDNY